MVYRFFLSEQRVGKRFFSSDSFFVMVRHILIFDIFISIFFTLRALLNEVVTVERIIEKLTIEVNILRQQHSEHMLDLCVCVKNHTNKKTFTS